MRADWFLDEERKEYQDDSLKWLHKRFGWLTERINEQSEQQMSEAKSLMQYAAELRNRSLRATEHALIFGVAVIAMIALAAAGLWIGVAGVALFLAGKYWWGFYVEKLGYRLDRFRERFRELLEPATGMGFRASDMLAEDKEFVRKYADSILYPLAVAPEKSYWYSPRGSDAKCLIRGRETPSASDLWHIETLYREYFHSPDHHHLEVGGWQFPEDRYLTEWQKKHRETCKFCQSAQRVRKHIDGVFSKFEAAVESARQTLITQIDSGIPPRPICAKDFLEDFRRWERGREIWGKRYETQPQDDEKLRPFPLLKMLRDKESWTFEEADKVRSLLTERELSDRLTLEMSRVAVQSGLEEWWKLYDCKRLLLGNSRAIRLIISRNKPETMIREMEERLYDFRSTMDTLKNFGGDAAFLMKEFAAAKKLLAKETGEWDRCYEKEFQATQGFALAERVVSERRYKEHLKLS